MFECRSFSVILTASLFCFAANSHAQAPQPKTAGRVELVGKVHIAGTTRDLSKLSQRLEDGTPADQFGGLSAIDYTGRANRFYLLSDRGAGDGAVRFPCRIHEVQLQLNTTSHSIDFQLINTLLLVNRKGVSLEGSLAAHAVDQAHPENPDWTAFDPEGLRCLPDGTFLISEEYGPRVVMFDASGHLLREMPIPASWRLRATEQGLPTIGAVPNRGLEGLALAVDKTHFVVALQSVLAQDGKFEQNKCLGLNSRWLVSDLTGSKQRQVVYRLENTTTGVSEVLALDAQRYLVLERDGNGGEAAKVKRIYLADVSAASDVSQIEHLPANEVPEHVRPVTKQLLLDLLDPQFGLAGPQAPEKPEGICWGPLLPDGRRTLWLACDNDFVATKTMDIYCFAVSID